MKRQKYVYNPKTLQFEKHTVASSAIALKIIAGLGIVLLAGVGIASVFYNYFPSPKEEALEKELSQLQLHYDQLNEEIVTISKVVSNIKERDESVYELMLGVDPIDPAVWEAGTGGRLRYSADRNLGKGDEIIKHTQDKLGKLERQVVLFSKSLDNVESMALEKSDRLISIPSIKPVREDKLKRDMILMSGYGMRMHPVHHIMKMHTGLDFTCPVGTVVRATGQGVVEKIEHKRTGYGKNIVIDHGYGYKTRYAHLSEIDVKIGDKVDKGQAIGKVGNTGTSTAPHLHYEVIHNGKHVDPIDFCLDGLTPTEYSDLVEQASKSTQSFD